ncbi:hypothetical protein UQ64_11530 [Paenibacillus etheri]|uniref:Methyl-accepting transducer domain-containing protein n=1 Tax=Paenibacillus etheri TaxID=1306852 RepID=A0A0W1B1P8_9BACL|nr:hypothetical protein UQ64_11530 [Paenibacillus etheri]
MNKISTQLTQMAQQHELAMGAFKKANDSLTQVNDGLHQINAGVGQLESGSKQLINRLRHGLVAQDK